MSELTRLGGNIAKLTIKPVKAYLIQALKATAAYLVISLFLLSMYIWGIYIKSGWLMIPSLVSFSLVSAIWLFIMYPIYRSSRALDSIDPATQEYKERIANIILVGYFFAAYMIISGLWQLEIHIVIFGTLIFGLIFLLALMGRASFIPKFLNFRAEIWIYLLTAMIIGSIALKTLPVQFTGKIKKIPVLVTGSEAKEISCRTIGEFNQIEFFDNVMNGEPRIWYHKESDGVYKLYNNPGYYPKSGQKLQPITEGVVKEIGQRLKINAEIQKKKDEDARIERDRQTEIRRQRELQEQRDREAALEAERQRIAAQKAKEEKEAAERAAWEEKHAILAGTPLKISIGKLEFPEYPVPDAIFSGKVWQPILNNGNKIVDEGTKVTLRIIKINAFNADTFTVDVEIEPVAIVFPDNTKIPIKASRINFSPFLPPSIFVGDQGQNQGVQETTEVKKGKNNEWLKILASAGVIAAKELLDRRYGSPLDRITDRNLRLVDGIRRGSPSYSRGTSQNPPKQETKRPTTTVHIDQRYPPAGSKSPNVYLLETRILELVMLVPFQSNPPQNQIETVP